MNKKLIIYISCGILAAIILGVSLFFILRNNNSTHSDNIYSTEKIIIEKYEEDGTAKTIEITKSKDIKELTKICDSVSLEQDETSESLAIRNDVKIDLNNGIIFFIQLDIEDYCYIENSNSDIKAVIKMPSGLLDYVKNALEENNA